MFNQSASKKLALAAAPLTLAVGLALGVTSVQAGYLTDSRGNVVTDNYGECWNATGGVPGPKEPCDPMQVAEADSDGDGVPDSRDECPGTPAGVAVDANGCPKDSDGDGVPDYRDKCPGTPAGAKVDADGCEIMASMVINVTTDHFDFDSAKLKPAMMSALDDVAAKVKASPGDESLSIVGHTDSTGPEAYNQGLSERRAEAAATYLVEQGVPASRITTSGMGESQPVADNSTREGRAMNRRVEIQTR
jgi:OOP family OmpA-OmpF porin